MRILVIEDEHKITNSIKKGLDQESFTVDVAYNGTDGYDLAAAENYGVIILDLMLPDMEGDRNLPKSSGRKYSYPNTYVDS